MKSTQKKKDLGIFYTPKDVVDLIINCSHSLKEHEDKLTARWNNHRPIAHFPSIIDPACGEGIFLKQAVSSGLTKRDYIFGADLDPSAVNNWESTSLLHEFEGDRVKLNLHFINQNGLLPIAWSEDQIALITNMHIKDEYIRKQQFDFVLGNPPYGGIGIGDFDLPINTGLDHALSRYTIWDKSDSKQSSLIDMSDQVDLSTDQKTRKSLEKSPIEVLFIERFLQLSKDPSNSKQGGKIAIVLPEGIFANSTLARVRKFIATHAKVLAIISLPRDTFKDTGTNAKTSILILEKTNKPIENNYPIFLASLTKNIPENFAIISNSFKEWIMNTTTKQIVDETNGLMIRVDKTIVDLNSEKPSSRWDPSYWHPKYDDFFKLLVKNFEAIPLGKYMLDGTQGITYGQVGERKYDDDGEIYYLQVSNIRITGIDVFAKYAKIKENSHNDPERSRLKVDDILLLNGGVGSLGRSCLVTSHEKFNISQDVDRIRVKEISPYYVTVFINSFFGQSQIERHLKGVSGQTKIGFEHVKSLLIPKLKQSIQSNIESQYKKMSAVHDMAMEAKSKGDTSAYESNLKTAEDMLKDLVSKTESVIRGEREDVV